MKPETRNRKKIYELDLDGPMFRKQRQLVQHLNFLQGHLAFGSDGDGVGDLLDGLTNMLDDIADQAHDNYDIDCLLTEKENVD